MKALADRLFWVAHYFKEQGSGRVDDKLREIAIEDLHQAIAIAEILPDTVGLLAPADRVAEFNRGRAPPERVVELPDSH